MMPSYSPDERDLRTVRLAGLDLPVRSTVIVVAVILLVIFDFQRTLIPDQLLRYDRNPEEQRMQAFSRLFLYLVVPLAIVILGFRDRPARYGLQVGDWRWGLGLALAGCVVMTPIVLVLAGQPDFRTYYSASFESLPGLLSTNVLDLFSTEFLFRGFLMLALARSPYRKVSDLFDDCNKACLGDASATRSIGDCISEIDCFNNGGAIDQDGLCGASPSGNCEVRALPSPFDTPGADTPQTCNAARKNDCTVVPPGELSPSLTACSSGGTKSPNPETCP